MYFLVLHVALSHQQMPSSEALPPSPLTPYTVNNFRITAQQQLVLEKFECVYKILCSLMNIRPKHLRSRVISLLGPFYGAI